MEKRRYILSSLSILTLLLMVSSSMVAFATPDSIDPRIRPEVQLTIQSSDDNLNDALSASMDYIYDFLVVGPEQYPVTEVEKRVTMFRDYGLKAVPSLWGSYHGKPHPNAHGYRENFCLRDIAHQTEGAVLLSLNEENYTMLELFAANALKPKRVNITASDFDIGNPEASAKNKSFVEKDWALWSYNFYGFPYYMDSGFQELPAPFELLEKVYRMYQYTGDPRWISDTFIDYGRMMHNRFMSTYDFNGNLVADNRGRIGTLPTLWEFEGNSHLTADDFIYDQSIIPAKLTIKKAYFERMGVQDLLLKVRFRNGKDDLFSVRINNLIKPDGDRPLLSRDYAEMNSRHDVDTIADLPVILNRPTGTTLNAVYDGLEPLIPDQDYTLNRDTVTIKANYFEKIKETKSADIKSSFGFRFSDGSQGNVVVQLTTRTPQNILDKHSIALDWRNLNDVVLRVDLSGTGGDHDLYRIQNDMHRVTEAGDTLGVQYQSILGLAGMLRAKAKLVPGQASSLLTEAKIYDKKAAALLQYYRTNYY